MALEEKGQMFRNRLDKVFRHRSKLARNQHISCYRIYDHDLPEFPFCIELYGDKLYVAEYRRRHQLTEEEHNGWLEMSIRIMSEVLGVAPGAIFLKLRRRKPGRLGQYQRIDTSQNEWVVMENGLQFIVNLGDYLDTGLFLDHRITRQMVREESSGKRVLNLFCYTGSFSVYALAGGAREVVSVDLSKTYLAWTERNIALNGWSDGEKSTLVHADVIQYLRQLKDARFDIIVLDPPTFSNSKRMDDLLDIQRDHVDLIQRCLDNLSTGGKLYFSTNYSRFELNQQQIRCSKLRDITRQTTPFDFEGKLKRFCFLLEK